MNSIRVTFVASVFLAAIATAGVCVAQAPSSSPATISAPGVSIAPKPTAKARVETWTRKQWEAAKREWAKDKTKWADCRTRSIQRKLKGRKSWSFLYECMSG